MTRRTLYAGAAIAMLIASQVAIEAHASVKAPTDHGGWGPRDTWDSHFYDGNIFDDYDRTGRTWPTNDQDDDRQGRVCTKIFPLPGRDREHRQVPCPDRRVIAEPKPEHSTPLPPPVRPEPPTPPVFEQPPSKFEPQPEPETPVVETPQPAPIPLPAPALLLLGALAGLGLMGKKR